MVNTSEEKIVIQAITLAEHGGVQFSVKIIWDNINGLTGE